MNFVKPEFYLFLLVFVIIYYLIPKRFRYIVIFLGSYFFYAYTDITLLYALATITLVSYVAGFLTNKTNTKVWLVLCVVFEVSYLCFFKYGKTVLQLFNSTLDNPIDVDASIFIMPIGLSFMVFQSLTYVIDVYREKIQPELNIMKYASFVAFFPTVMSGPIQKARILLPQISNPSKFDPQKAKSGTLLIVWGLFQKLMVSNMLLVMVNTIYNNYQNYDWKILIVGAILFSFYIYADFSSYSDLARGVGRVLGIEVGKNFDNPYLSKSTSEFWNRWHMSLNTWFIENIYIPLGGNRKGQFRKYINVMIVFTISGIWHGAELHYVAWGVINGLLVIIGSILLPAKKKLFMNRAGTNKVLTIFKILITFILITLTWIFFKLGVNDSINYITRIFTLSGGQSGLSTLLHLSKSGMYSLISYISLFMFVIVQLGRTKQSQVFKWFSSKNFILQGAVVGVFVAICIVFMLTTDAQVNTQFLYFQF